MGASVTVKSYRKERETEIMGGLEKALEKVGRIVEKDAAKNIIIHSSRTPWDDTGQIASSVTHVVTGLSVEIGIPGSATVKDGGSVAKIGKALELGHIQHPGQFVPSIGKRLVASDVPPYPWLFPAVEANRERILSILKSSGAAGVSIE